MDCCLAIKVILILSPLLQAGSFLYFLSINRTVLEIIKPDHSITWIKTYATLMKVPF